MKCDKCNRKIDNERLEMLPDTTKCFFCATRNDIDPPLGYMYFNHKTGGNMQVVDKSTLVDFNRMDRRGRKRNRLSI